jgi:hypothetical protein
VCASIVRRSFFVVVFIFIGLLLEGAGREGAA